MVRWVRALGCGAVVAIKSSSFASSDRCFVIVETQRVFLGGGPALLCGSGACFVCPCVVRPLPCAPAFLAPAVSCVFRRARARGCVCVCVCVRALFSFVSFCLVA